MALDLTEPGAFAKAFKCNFSGNVDVSCCPQHDFYSYANGKWLATNPIPDIYPAWGSFLMLRDANEERCRKILDSGEPPQDPKEKYLFDLCKTFYNAAMDEKAIEEKGTSGYFDSMLSSVTSLSTLASLTPLVADLHSKGVSCFFSYGETIDKKDSDMTIAGISQSGLGLPDRDYYFDEDKEDKRGLYKKHVEKMLEMIGEDEPAKKAEDIFELEKSLASKFMTKTELRNPEATYNIVTIAELDAKCPGIDWTSYLASSHSVEPASVTSTVGKINLSTVSALTNLGVILQETSLDTVKSYLKWKIVKAYAVHLSSKFVEENFDFYSRTLAGTKENKPRWKRAMAMVESYLGEALGQLYVAEHFSGDAKPKALEIVESVRDALKDRLQEVEWMGEETRAKAMEKMSGFRVQIGFPDEWIDYSYFEKKLGPDHVANIAVGNSFEHMREIARINKPTDKNRWYMSPQTVNAYYHPSMNLICFPAAILQPPFFDLEADDAVNYGGMGAVVGHEMTHGFDDQGSKYDAQGNLVNWWSENDLKSYEGRVDVMIKQAEEHEVLGIKLKGKLTAGENLADLGGLRLSLRALKKKMGEEPLSGPNAKLVDGFTPLQRFFLSWATVWRQNIKDERAKQLVTIDPHGPNDFRANGPLRNMEEFYEAFDVKESDPMFKPKEDRVDVW